MRAVHLESALLIFKRSQQLILSFARPTREQTVNIGDGENFVKAIDLRACRLRLSARIG